jgi:ubiquinone/menaquinone biosynthesis C-methylase UbiE
VAKIVYPFWLGYLLIHPIRKLFENPYQLLGSVAREGMVVLEPGSGMGYFTLPLADLVGPSGRVIAVDIEPKMLAVLGKRALKAGMINRIERRLCQPDRLNVESLRESVDLAVLIHMLHETPDPERFLEEIRQALKKEGLLLIREPKIHVPKRDFEHCIALARRRGFSPDGPHSGSEGHQVLLKKS